MIFVKNKKYITCKSHWKISGVLDEFNDEYKTLYRIYMSTKFCDTCGISLIQGNYGVNRKCLDHCHTSGNFRGVLCHICNVCDGRTKPERIENLKGKMNVYNKSYRLENKDYFKKYMIEYRLENKYRMKKQKSGYYQWKKIQKEFLNIYTE
tara:strand:- start:1 stop:453 length:453 start_codon:yes stop_codon:yes gene_type:complete